MTLRDRLIALADGTRYTDGYSLVERSRMIALAAARMALEDAAQVCSPPISFDHVDCRVAIRALRDRLEKL